MGVVMLEGEVPATRRVAFVRVGQIRGVHVRDATLDVDVEIPADWRDGGCYAIVTADPAGQTLRPGPLAIWAHHSGRGVTLGGTNPTVVAGDWLWWERVERPS